MNRHEHDANESDHSSLSCDWWASLYLYVCPMTSAFTSSFAFFLSLTHSLSLSLPFFTWYPYRHSVKALSLLSYMLEQTTRENKFAWDHWLFFFLQTTSRLIIGNEWSIPTLFYMFSWEIKHIDQWITHVLWVNLLDCNQRLTISI
jgi:hypothetical protein